MHPYADSAKFPSFACQGDKDVRAALANHAGNGAGAGGQLELGSIAVADEYTLGHRTGQQPADRAQKRVFPDPPIIPGFELRVGFNDARNAGEGAGTGHRSRGGRNTVAAGGKPLNIILVTSATARARTITLDWWHWCAAGLLLCTLFGGFTFAFNYATLRWAAGVQHPWLKTMALADQREEARRTSEKIQGHLNAMAMRLGELQAQMMRLDGLGERLARVAGLKPQELPSLQPGAVPGRGGPAPGARDLSMQEFTSLVDKLALDVEERSDQLGVLEALLVQTSSTRKFLPSLAPVIAGWRSSDFGHRIDPFTGQNSFHEGIDFPAERGAPVVAAASGKVVYSGWHPQYGKLLEIDHGNGLMSRYAHASTLLAGEGDLVVRGQRVAAVGSTGRSTGPHLHFEVRLNGVPQNPARFLAASQ